MPEFGAGATPPTYVTALPSSAYDGQEIHYAADTTNGVIWHLRYRSGSGSSYKWEFVGGPPLVAEVATEEPVSTTTTSYTTLATAGPSVTVPLAGDYDVQVGSLSYVGGTAANGFTYHSYDIGGTGAVDTNALEYRGTGSGNVPEVSGTRLRRQTGLSASTALVSKYKQSAAVTNACYFKNRWMRVTPVRVG